MTNRFYTGEEFDEAVQEAYQEGYEAGSYSVNTGCENCGSSGAHCSLCNDDEWHHCKGCGEWIADVPGNDGSYPQDCGNGLCPECIIGPASLTQMYGRNGESL